MDADLKYQIFIVDPHRDIQEPVCDVFRVQQPKVSSAAVASTDHCLRAVGCPVFGTLLQHKVHLHAAEHSKALVSQLTAFKLAGHSIDVMIYHFDINRYRSAIWELQSITSAFPALDIIVCANTADDRWVELRQEIKEQSNLLIARTPLEPTEVRQLVILLLRKQQQRKLLGRVCQEREHHVEARTRHISNALEESRRLLSAIDLVLIELNSQQVVCRWNHEAERILGLPKACTIGRNIRELDISWDDQSAIDQFLALGESAQRTLEISLHQPDNTSVILSLTRHTIHYANEPDGVLILGVDLTEQRRLQQHLQQAQRLESVGQLAAGVAHEINTPMQYIGDNIDYLSNKFINLLPYLEGTLKYLKEESDLPSDQKNELKQDLLNISKKQKITRLANQVPSAFADSQQGLQHVTRIIRAMKELSHPGGTERTAVNINHLLETAITVSTNEWKYVAEINHELSEDIVDIPGYPGELAQVFMNLIVNAAHAIGDFNELDGRERGRINVISRMESVHVVIEIHDNGGGIPAEIADRIFDPFFTTKQIGKGTGQGLAIAHSVVVGKHQGRIDFHPSAGQGTAFIIHLPVDQYQPSQAGVFE